MENDTSKNVKVKIKPSIFSQKQINAIVKDFVIAFLRGEITIKFKDAAEFMHEGMLAKRKVDVDSAIYQELAVKLPFIDLISVCCGVKPASSEERKKAVNTLFEIIVAARLGGRLKGTFIQSPSAEIEKRLTRLEQNLAETSNLVGQIADYLRNRLQRGET